ncbi:hypothetical protein E9529_19220 [Blastococcus sp. KM273128]|uniref:hypothetical protein n=1 Tax=Blastococcus sp. KM273128 TaxID=2570314 RepID=UPI001F22F636|nr:hypothetical protein [Blastococcus sp. KM273128]MCF6746363.1 hypothetical protein [Blastococcus sp. KM273128]
MTVHAHHPGVVPSSTQERSSAERPAQKQPVKDHNLLIGLGVLAAVVLVFTAMVVLTMLAGGDGYVR